MFQRQVRVLSEIRLPKESKVLDSFQPSYLMVMDDLVPTFYTIVILIYQNGIDFNQLLKVLVGRLFIVIVGLTDSGHINTQM